MHAGTDATRRSRRRWRTIEEAAAPYGGYLVAVPPAAPGVCATCRGPVYGDYERCFPCTDTQRILGDQVADVVGFVSLAPNGAALARELLYGYKDERTCPVQRRVRQTGLSALLWTWLVRHEGCLAAALDREHFDVITTTPSTCGRVGAHPLRHVVGAVVAGSADRHQDVLAVGRADLTPRDAAADRYRATRALDGAAVLVVDDTWATGAHAQSASAALKSAGAAAVALLAIGRWLEPSFKGNAAWLAQHRGGDWDWDRCCLDAPAR